MGRWRPDARGRLAKAAFELYAEQGYEKTTGAEIAQRAGMHERSFFRLFGDKREVTFHGMQDVAADLVTAIRDAPGGLTAIQLAERAFEERCALMQGHPEHARLRRAIILSSSDLGERDLAKQEELASAVAGALRERGVAPVAATLASESCLLAFRVSVDTWLDDPDAGDLVGVFRDTLRALGAAIGDRGRAERDREP